MESSLQRALRFEQQTSVDPCNGITSVFCKPDPYVRWAYRLVRATLGIIFICSGVLKLLEPNNFATIIDAYGLIPQVALMPAAWGLALLEVVAGAGLVLDMQCALGTITGLLIVFMVVLGYGLWIGLDIDCGCFGPDDPEGAAYHSLRPAFIRDLALLAASGCIYFWRRRQPFYPMKYSTLYQIIINVKRRI